MSSNAHASSRSKAVLAEDVDVFAPCALGAMLNAHSIAQLRARIVAGAANNQLAKDSDGLPCRPPASCTRRTMSSTPAASSASTREYLGGSSEAQVNAEIHGIPARLTEIFERARRENRPTNVVADQLAQERIDTAQRRLVA